MDPPDPKPWRRGPGRLPKPPAPLLFHIAAEAEQDEARSEEPGREEKAAAGEGDESADDSSLDSFFDKYFDSDAEDDGDQAEDQHEEEAMTEYLGLPVDGLVRATASALNDMYMEIVKGAAAAALAGARSARRSCQVHWDARRLQIGACARVGP